VDKHFSRGFLAFVALAATGSAGAATPLPVPATTLEQALNTNVISQIERSTRFDKTMPQIGKPAKPAIDPAQGVEVRDDVYLDRALASQGASRSDEKAILVSPRDRR